MGDVPEHSFSLFEGERLDFEGGTVDRIFCLDALHHVPDPTAVLREMARVLKDGGIAGFSEPGPNHSKDGEAQREMCSWRVIENDIVLSRLFENSRQYGFTDLKLSVATIHPPLVPFDEITGYLSQPTVFLDALRERVTNYPIFFLYKGDPTIRDSRSALDLSARIILSPTSLVVKKGEPVKLRADIVNTSPKVWRKYSLEIDLVSENVCWFQSHSGVMATATITVI